MQSEEKEQRQTGRRSFLKGGALATSALVTAGLFGKASALAQPAGDENEDGDLTDGDAAILRFLAETVQREQASSWSYEIRETDILFR